METHKVVITCDAPNCRSYYEPAISDCAKLERALQMRGWRVTPKSDNAPSKHYCPGCARKVPEELKVAEQ